MGWLYLRVFIKISYGELEPESKAMATERRIMAECWGSHSIPIAMKIESKYKEWSFGVHRECQALQLQIRFFFPHEEKIYKTMYLLLPIHTTPNMWILPITSWDHCPMLLFFMELNTIRVNFFLQALKKIKKLKNNYVL